MKNKRKYNKPFSIVASIGLFTIPLIIFTYTDYKISSSILMKDQKSQLNRHREIIVTSLKQDLNRTLSIDTINEKLRYNFLGESYKFVENKDIDTDSNQEFMIINLIKKQIMISPTILESNLERTLPTNIGIKLLNNNKVSDDNNVHEIVKDNLYIKLWINHSYGQNIKQFFLLCAIFKAILMELLGCIIIYFYKYHKININVIQFSNSELLEKVDTEIEINNLSGEHNLLTKFVSSDGSVNVYELKYIESLCQDIEKFFYQKVKSLKINNLIPEEPFKLTINKNEFSRLIFSILYHKIQISNQVDILIIVQIDGNKLIVRLQDNGFKLCLEKMIKYSMKKGYNHHLAMKGSLILSYLKENNIPGGHSVEGNNSILKIEFPIKTDVKDVKGSNICYLKDYQ